MLFAWLLTILFPPDIEGVVVDCAVYGFDLVARPDAEPLDRQGWIKIDTGDEVIRIDLEDRVFWQEKENWPRDAR